MSVKSLPYQSIKGFKKMKTFVQALLVILLTIGILAVSLSVALGSVVGTFFALMVTVPLAFAIDALARL